MIIELMRKKDDAVNLKRSHHARMLENMRAYNGSEDKAPDPDINFPRTNPTKSRVNTIGARLGVVFKDNEENFGLEPTPETEGDPEAVAASLRIMEKKIRDCLVESRFSSSARLAIRNHLVALGVMIVKAPVLRMCQKRRYKQTQSEIGPVYQMQIEKTVKPLVEFIDPFYWFPEAVGSVDDLEHCFEVHMFNKRQMLALKDQPGIDGKAIDAIVEEKPEREEVHTMIEQQMSIGLEATAVNLDKYAVWEFHGMLSDEDYEHAAKKYKFPDGSCGMVEAWFCGDKIIKCIAAPFDSEYRVPYLTVSYEDKSGTLFGAGVAQLYAPTQRAVDKGWRAYQHNNAVSAGPQIGIDATGVEPADGRWRINGPKIWKITDPQKSVKDCIQHINIENNSQQHLEMIQAAIRMGDDEINYPSMLAGDEGNATSAIYATNGNNIIIFGIGLKIDAQIINPLIHRLYWYFMEFDDDFSAKGDYAIKAKGADNLLINDLEMQKMQGIVGLAQNPMFGQYLNNYEILKAIVNLMDGDVDKVLRPQEEVDQQQQPDVRQVMMEKEIEIKQGKLEAQNRQIEMQAQNLASNQQLERERLAAEVEMNRIEAEAKVLAINVSQDTEQMKIAAKVGIEQQKAAASSITKENDKKTDAFFKQQQINLQAERENTKREEMRLKMDARNKSGTGI